MRDRLPRRDTALITGAAALALSFTPSLLERRRGDQARISVAAAVLGVVAGAGTELAVLRLAERLRGGEPAARGALAVAGIAAAALRLPAHRRSGVGLAGTGAIVAGGAALLGGLTPVRRFDPLHDPWMTVLGAAVAACAAVGAGAAQRRRPRVPLRVYPDAPLPTVGEGEGSLVAPDTLDFEASRFLRCALPAADIVTLRGGGEAIDPIRVFVGLRSAPDPAARARLAVDELERLGAFARRRILVCSATLRGYVNPVPLQAEELFARGDVASVCVQYFDRPTLLMPFKARDATETHRALLEELARRVPADGPEIVVYGESLGAWGSQDVFREAGALTLDALRVSRALWAGTPFLARLGRQVEGSDPRFGVLPARELLEADVVDAERLRFVFLTRPIDPVVAFGGLHLLWREPEWLDELPEPRRMRWIPGITFLQMLGDLVRATRWTSQVPQAAAHDYRVELPLAIDVVFSHRLERSQALALGDALIALEIARGERLRALRRGREDPGMPPLEPRGEGTT